MLKVGFSGTREGMTFAQQGKLTDTLVELSLRPTDDSGVVEFHHGDCVGADAEADKIARNLGFEIHIHPPKIVIRRAFCWKDGDVLYLEQAYHARNRTIVAKTDRLIACPMSPEPRDGGTWYTIRHSWDQGRFKMSKIIFHDGTTFIQGGRW